MHDFWQTHSTSLYLGIIRQALAVVPPITIQTAKRFEFAAKKINRTAENYVLKMVY